MDNYAIFFYHVFIEVTWEVGYDGEEVNYTDGEHPAFDSANS